MNSAIYNSDTITIIAGGHSAAGIDFNRFALAGYILACKDSYFHVKQATGCFTMDRRWNIHRLQKLKEMDAEVFASAKHWGYKHPGIPPVAPWERVKLIKVHVDRPGLSTDPTCLHGKNSGFAALNLAYHCKPRRIFLFGFDLTIPPGANEHWYETYEWRQPRKNYNGYKSWAQDHDHAAPLFKQAGIEVYNVSNISLINSYKVITVDEAMSLLK